METSGKKSRVIYTDEPGATLRETISELAPDKVYLLTDDNVSHHLAKLGDFPLERAEPIIIPSGEESKSLATAMQIWDRLIESGATRRSLMVNIGGGVVSDVGGFSASVFKRGIRYMNVPTTVLSAADASIGGKTGIDYRGLKNEIGVFTQPERVIVSPVWFDTLSREEVLSGFGEMVKMAMLGDRGLYEELVAGDAMSDKALFDRALRHASEAKERIVELDPREGGLRRILNFGHTIGHANEMRSAQKGNSVTHGAAVAHGISAALQLSERYCGLDAEVTKTYKKKILDRYYAPLPTDARDLAELRRLIRHDKKNRNAGRASFVLLRDIGEPVESVEIEINTLFRED